MGQAQRGVIVHAYSASQGALYESAPALDALLGNAYIAVDVPVHMIGLPADVLCIVPDPLWAGRRRGIDAILLFRRKEVDGEMADALGIQTWGRAGVGDERRVRLQLLELPIAGTEQTPRLIFFNTCKAHFFIVTSEWSTRRERVSNGI